MARLTVGDRAARKDAAEPAVSTLVLAARAILDVLDA